MYGDSKGDFLQRDPYSKRALLEESMINVASVFKVLQSCGAGMACRKSSQDFSSSALFSCHEACAVVRKNNDKSAMHR